MRTYEQTHPWISFHVDLHEARPQFWLWLGEAASKCDHLAGVPLRPNTAKRLQSLYLAKGVLATTAIEGNTLTEDEVLRHLDGTLHLSPSKEYLGQEIDNIVNACNEILAALQGGDELLTTEKICLYNKQVLHQLEVEEDVVPGQLRYHSVTVGNVYRGAPAEDGEYLLDRLCTWLAGPDFRAPQGMETAIALIKAILAHVYLAWIHPFGDGNGRTARLMEFQILLAAGVPTPAAHLLSNHYNLTRSEYYRQLVQASHNGGNLLPFLEYAVCGFVDGLREQLDYIREQQLDVAWRSFVHELFRDGNSPQSKRQRDLLLDLSRQKHPVPLGKVNELTPRLAKDYANKTDKTFRRDMAALKQHGLIEVTSEGVRAKSEIIAAFLPWRKPGG